MCPQFWMLQLLSLENVQIVSLVQNLQSDGKKSNINNKKKQKLPTRLNSMMTSIQRLICFLSRLLIQGRYPAKLQSELLKGLLGCRNKNCFQFNVQLHILDRKFHFLGSITYKNKIHSVLNPVFSKYYFSLERITSRIAIITVMTKKLYK